MEVFDDEIKSKDSDVVFVVGLRSPLGCTYTRSVWQESANYERRLWSFWERQIGYRHPAENGLQQSNQHTGQQLNDGGRSGAGQGKGADRSLSVPGPAE